MRDPHSAPQLAAQAAYPMTYLEIAKVLEITPQEVYHIERRALWKCRQWIQAHDPALRDISNP